MPTHPENKFGVVAVPAAAPVFGEEAPGFLVVFVLHENADSAAGSGVANVGAGGHVFFPNNGEEEGPGAVHDGYVREAPVVVVGLEGLEDAQEEGVLGSGAHGVVGYSGGDGTVQPGGVGEQGIETSVTALFGVS